MNIEEIDRIMLSDLASIKSLILSLVAKVEHLENENKELKRQLGQNSQNSNWPPSSDLKREPKNHRKSGGKKGGPVGHKGHTLSCIDDPTTTIIHPVLVCENCAVSLEDVACLGYERRQVFDIPVPVMEVTEHRAEKKKCPCCHTLQKGIFPKGVHARAQYGERFTAVAAYLHTHQMLPLARTTDLLHVLTGCRPSQATLLSSIRKMAESLLPYEEVIRHNLLASPVIHADETGVHVDKEGHWVHVNSTKNWTLLGVHSSRGTAGMKSLNVLPSYTGTVIHDFYGPYFKQDKDFTFKHALCNAHLSRECKGIEEYDGHRWASAMLTLLHTSWSITRKTRKLGRPLTETAIGNYERRYEMILEMGKVELEKEPLLQSGRRGKPRKSKAANLWARFRDHKESILGYLRDANIPFDNNQAERDLRMIAVKRKISGCFRSETTPGFFATIRSFISTLIKQNHPILTSLK
ncbi:hypothetical protein BC351_25885, partial [Paenibacillus ferrarius]